MIRVLIVDDEPLARDCIRLALKDATDFQVVGEASDGASAVEAIRRLQPELVFLDVQMPGMDGFAVIEEVGPAAMPDVIFVTAYDQHAIRAFEVHALDYMLKPFDDDRFRESLRHARARVRESRGHALADQLEALLRDRTREKEARVRRLMIRDRQRIRSVAVKDVDYFVAEGNYIRLHVGTQSYLVRMTLGRLEQHLDSTQFVRIHRSTIVNLDRVTEIQPWSAGDYVAVLHDQRTLKVSRHYRDALLKPLH
jgi:two-component system LytT family response regulator